MALHSEDVDRLLDPGYAADLAGVPLEELRVRRDACQRAEVALSYVRRVLQGELDLVGAELEARRQGVRGDATRLIDDLPAILAGPPGSGAPPPLPAEEGAGAQDRRHLPRLTMPGAAEGWNDQSELDLEELVAEVLSREVLQARDVPPSLPGANLGAFGDEDLEAVAVWLRGGEQSVSANRRALHDRIELLQGEIVERYKVGAASPDALLS